MAMTTPRRDEPNRIIFIGLSLILAALLVYFALSSIPSALRPTLSPSTNASVSTASTQP
jgi:hypothetical protein